MERKNLAIIILVILLTTSGFGNIILGIPHSGSKSYESKNVLRIACSDANSPAVLDPVDSWYDASNDMIRHVCDTLWSYDLTDPTYPLEMRLATSYSWNIDMDELTVTLREDVWFHDGAKFNATAVKFTFDRIMYFINWSGELPGTSHVCDPASLFYDMFGDPILNRTEIIDEYSIKFVLNKPNGIFISLLTYEACSILHPDSANATEYLRLLEDTLIGTGPFKYIHFIPGEEILFKRWDLYWDSNIFWDEMRWVYYSDTPTASISFMNGETDYLGTVSMEFMQSYQTDEYLDVVELKTGSHFIYWGINNRRINDSRIQKAIAYAYNYSYFIEEACQGYAIKVEQLIPPEFPYYNASFKGPYYNTSIARQAMMDAFPVQTATAGCTSEPFGANPTNDAAWSDLRLLTYVLYEYNGWKKGFEMILAFVDDMDVIGIEICPTIYDPFVLPFPPYLLPFDPYALEIWYDEWSPNYIDPFNMLEPLLNTGSDANQLQCQDALIHQWLEQYEETDPANTTRRAQLLYKIQQRAINELYALIPLGFDKIYYVHHRSLGGVSYNIMDKLWLADSYYIPGIPTI